MLPWTLLQLYASLWVLLMLFHSLRMRFRSAGQPPKTDVLLPRLISVVYVQDLELLTRHFIFDLYFIILIRARKAMCNHRVHADLWPIF